jgi:hypothetical protein
MRTLASLVAILGLAGCFSGNLDDSRYQEQVHRTLPSAGVKTLSVDNTAGRVRVEAWNQPDVRIDATKKARDAQGLAAMHIDISSAGDTINVKSVYDVGISNGNVEYTIKAPASLAVHVSNIAGTARVDGFIGNVHVDTQAGTVDVTLPKLGGDQVVDLSTTTGTLALSIPKNSNATVKAHTTVGTFSSDFPSVNASREMVVGEGGGGTIGNGSAKVSLSTTTGTIALDSH